MQSKHLIGILLFFLSIPLTAFSLSRESCNREEIVIISSYNSDSRYVLENIHSFVSNYKRLEGVYSPVIENMNCYGMETAGSWMSISHNIFKKHKNIKLVVLVGLEAAVTYLSLDEERFKKIPVYCIMCPQYAATLPQKYGITAVANDTLQTLDIIELFKDHNLRYALTYNYGIKDNLQLIQRLFPEKKYLTVLSDNTYSRLSNQSEIKKIVANNTSFTFNYIDGQSLSMRECLEKYEKQNDSTALLLCGWRIDQTGSVYLNNSSYAFRLLKPRIPVFSLTGTAIGSWAIGGYIPKYRTAGVELAYRAKAEIDNKKIVPAYIDSLKKEYVLDQNVLSSYHIPAKVLPKNARILNPEITYIDILKKYIWTFTVSLFFFLAIIIALIRSIRYNRKLNRLTRKLSRSEEKIRKEKDELIESEKKLRIATAAAENANRLKSTFVSNMSHEIRTPLNAIVGFSDVISSEMIVEHPEYKEYAETINQNSKLLLQLVNDVLDLSRLESGKMKFTYETSLLSTICRSAIASFKAQADNHVNLYYTTENEHLEITTDPLRLQQVITNLISNAKKFTTEGSIHLNASYNQEEDRITISVTDTGCGIPKAMQKNIFNRFEKVNEFTQGTGLGLEICRKIIQIMDGKIYLDTTYTEGSRFVVQIPSHHSLGEQTEKI